MSVCVCVGGVDHKSIGVQEHPQQHNEIQCQKKEEKGKRGGNENETRERETKTLLDLI